MVTEEERDEIQTLFERQNALKELFPSLTTMDVDESNALYEKMIKDMGSVSAKLKLWWKEKSIAYNWDNIPGHKWEIDFESCEIYLVKM